MCCSRVRMRRRYPKGSIFIAHQPFRLRLPRILAMAMATASVLPRLSACVRVVPAWLIAVLVRLARVLVPDCGSYTSAAATAFNGFAPAQTIVWEEQQVLREESAVS